MSPMYGFDLVENWTPAVQLAVRRYPSSYLPVAFHLGRANSKEYSKTSYINQNETQEPLEPWTSSDPLTHKDSSSLTGQNHSSNL
jgi:hypothetical protein